MKFENFEAVGERTARGGGS